MKKTDTQKLVELLSELEPGFLEYPVFEQIARIIALPILEFVPLKMTDRSVEVLLLERPKDDNIWAGQLHTPGTVIRATDISTDQKQNWKAFDRITHDELKDTKISNPHYVGSVFHQSRRGVEQAQIYWVEILGSSNVGRLYPVDELPSKLIEAQI